MSTATLAESPAASRMLPRYRELGYPEVAPVPEGADRPFWSVMIPTFNCAELLRLTLRAVLAQDPGPDQMQVEVIDDCSTKDDPEAVVREVGGGRVAFHRQPKNVGATGNFNACLERSRGRYVQVLHGDDLVLPGFYASMRALLESHPEAGSAHCQFAIIDDDGYWTGLGEVVHRARGVYPGALDRMSTYNFAQFAAVVLRRSLVEEVGGFHPSLIHAADWDLWRRASLHAPTLFEPTVLACYRVFQANDTARLLRTAGNLVDVHRAIELGSRYLPEALRGPAEAQARQNYGRMGLRTAREFLWRLDAESAANQYREALRIWPGGRRDPLAREVRGALARRRVAGWLRRIGLKSGPADAGPRG